MLFSPRSCISRHLWNQNACEISSAPFTLCSSSEKICQKVRKYQRMPRKISSCSSPVNLRASIKKASLLGTSDSQSRGRRLAYMCSLFRVSRPQHPGWPGLAILITSLGETRGLWKPPLLFHSESTLECFASYSTVSINLVIFLMP